MLLKLLEKDVSEVPGKFLPVSYMGGKTTLPEENAKLGISSNHGQSH